MKRILLLFPILITGCATPHASFEATPLKTNEILGAGYEHLDGKLFSVFCGGNGYADYNFVKESCMSDTAGLVHNKGYEYFSMLAKDGDTSKIQSGYVSDGVFIPTEIIKHSQYYTILLINKDEINKFKNFYKVSDYYTPPATEDKMP